VVLEGGGIAESGTHDELVARGGAYARFYRRQLLEEQLEETSGQEESDGSTHQIGDGEART
jgi:ATP-binding cassette subfamily B protein